MILGLGVLVVCLATGGGASAATIGELTSNSNCSVRNPASGYSYTFCDDGLPPVGGTTPNQSGSNAIKVPAKYQETGGDDWTGLPGKAADAASMAGADNQGNVALDVDVSLPTTPAPAGGYPLIVFMHGCCSGNKTSWEATSFDAGGEKWHYNNAWFASRGYVVITFTARGFVSGESSGNVGSTGETQLDSRRFEINDYQELAGLVADETDLDPSSQRVVRVDPQKVATTGGSYGGGFSWLALTDPFWKSPGGKDMKLAVTAPKYGWTDLIDSLIPSGRHFQTPDNLPATDGSDSFVCDNLTQSCRLLGIPKKSINAALYDSGKTGIPPGSAHTTFPSYIDQSFACLNSTDPFETNPLCTTQEIFDTLRSFRDDRSPYYQNDFFSKIASDPSYRIPVFNAATFTDPLFPPVENRRMSNRLQTVVPGYPIQQYFGDYQHFVQNKAKEWGDLCGADHHVCTVGDYPGGDVNATPSNFVRTGVTTRLNRFVDHYAQPPGNPSEPQPAFDVTASLQICPQNAPLESTAADEPGPTFNGPDFASLTQGQLEVDFSGAQTTVNDASPNSHAANSDPVANFAANGGKCPVETTPAGPGVATYDSRPLPSDATMIGATSVTIDYTSTAPPDGPTQGLFQLDSRLYDVFPNGTAVMVDRGVRRVTNPNGTVTYELHGNGWRFRAGHRIRIEIAQDDDPYLKPSNVPSSATLTQVKLLIPTRESFDYPRPLGASPLRVSLVPAFAPCNPASANATHASPLAGQSCSPPVPNSSLLAVGPKSLGFVRMMVLGQGQCAPFNPSRCYPDVVMRASITDVRSGGPTGPDYVSDTSQSLTAVATLPGSQLGKGVQITDKANTPDGSGGFGSAATVVPLPFPIPISCNPTTATDVGSTCEAQTTANTLAPGAAAAGNRAIWELGQIEILDLGADSTPGTNDDAVFETQGVFTP